MRRYVLFADRDATRYIRHIPPDEARRLIFRGQAVQLEPVGKIIPLCVTGTGNAAPDPFSRAIRVPVGTPMTGYVYAMQLKTMHGSMLL